MAKNEKPVKEVVKETPQKSFTFTLPEAVAEAAIAAYAKLTRSRVRSTAAQPDTQLDPAVVDKALAATDLELVTRGIRQQILAVYEREVMAEAQKKVRDQY